MKTGRWSRWKGRRLGGAGCEETERACRYPADSPIDPEEADRDNVRFKRMKYLSRTASTSKSTQITAPSTKYNLCIAVLVN